MWTEFTNLILANAIAQGPDRDSAARGLIGVGYHDRS
jgi:hypothetical protein